MIVPRNTTEIYFRCPGRYTETTQAMRSVCMRLTKKRVYADGNEILIREYEITIEPSEREPSAISHIQDRRKLCRWRGSVESGALLVKVPTVVT